MSHNIETILKQAKEGKWPYPKTFDLLKEEGVETYEIYLANYDNSYKGTFGEWKESAPKGYTPLTISDAFSKETISDSIRRHQKGETTFIEVIAEVAAAGVDHYRVDMSERTVTYYDKDEQNQHQEHVPIFKE